MTRQTRNSRWSVPPRMCRKPSLNEPERGLIPARIEPDQAHVARILEGADGAARRQEPQHRDRPLAEPRKPRVDRELGPIRLDRVLDQHVDAAPGSRTAPCRPGAARRSRVRAPRRSEPNDLSAGSEARTAAMRAPPSTVSPSYSSMLLTSQTRGGVVQDRSSARPTSSRSAPRMGYSTSRMRLERRTHQHAGARWPSGFTKHLDRDVVRDVVRRDGQRPARGRRR